MRIDEQNLDSLRKIVRELQQENEDLKALLKQHQIAYESNFHGTRYHRVKIDNHMGI